MHPFPASPADTLPTAQQRPQTSRANSLGPREGRGWWYQDEEDTGLYKVSGFEKEKRKRTIFRDTRGHLPGRNLAQCRVINVKLNKVK